MRKRINTENRTGMKRTLARRAAAFSAAACMLLCCGAGSITAAGESVSEEFETEEQTEAESISAPDFSLPDQYGEIHTLEDYRGKVIFLNFWATWCQYCVEEMPEIQELYEKYKDSEDVAVLGVAFPEQSGEGTVEELTAFLAENGFTYPVLMDTSPDLMWQYQISAFPTTFMIDREGKLFGYMPGAMSLEMMEEIVQLTLDES